jgi:hypothetical protein
MQDHPSDVRERCTVADRCEPLGSPGMWTKLHTDRIVAHADGFGACHTAA